MAAKSLRDLYVQSLRDLYDAENQITQALPRMAQHAHSQRLQQAFEEHWEVSRKQIERLEQLFRALGERPTGVKCAGIQGLIKECEELIQQKVEPNLLDAGLVATAQHMDHYEIAGYRAARTYAGMLGDSEAAALLQQTLDEEAASDRRLAQIVDGLLNERAERAVGSS